MARRKSRAHPKVAAPEAVAPLTAVSKALNTVELLETIILNLAQIEVFKVKSVSKLWRDTIAGSIRLQVALGSKPLQIEALKGGNRELAKRIKGEGSEEMAQPWLITSRGGLIRKGLSTQSFYDTCVRNAEDRKATLNPLLYRLFRRELRGDRDSEDGRPKRYWLELSLEEFFRYATSIPKSWESAPLTQPPLLRTRVCFELESPAWELGYCTTSSNTEERTFHEMFDDSGKDCIEHMGEQLSEDYGWKWEKDDSMIFSKEEVLYPGTSIGALFSEYRDIWSMCRNFNADWWVSIGISQDPGAQEESEDDGDGE